MTERYTISDQISDPLKREALEKAIKASKLPEEVTVISGDEGDYPSPPFIVVYSGSTETFPHRNLIKAFRGGALDVLPMDFNHSRFVESLNNTQNQPVSNFRRMK